MPLRRNSSCRCILTTNCLLCLPLRRHEAKHKTHPSLSLLPLKVWGSLGQLGARIVVR